MQLLSHGLEEGHRLKTFGDRKFLTGVRNVFENFLQQGKFQAMDVKKVPHERLMHIFLYKTLVSKTQNLKKKTSLCSDIR